MIFPSSEAPLFNSKNILSSLESAAKYVGLHFNESKPEYIFKCKEDYNYLGSFISSSEKDFNVRKGMTCT